MMQCRVILLCLVLAFFCSSLGAPRLSAQPNDTVIVHTNLPVVFNSKWPHFAGTAYRWTIEGSGNFGDAGTDLNIIADARFALGSINNRSNPRLPLSDKQNGFEGYCDRVAGACNIFLAVNAPADNNYLLERLEPVNAAELKRFRFVPREDVYNPDHRYVISVTGNGGPGQFMFVDRYDRELGPAVQEFYNDNFTGEDTTQFRVIIQRESPQLLVRDTEKELLITPPDRILKSAQIDFGKLSVGQEGRTIERVLLNGALEDLQISRLELVGSAADLAHFAVRRSDGNALNDPADLQRDINSLGLACSFEPQGVGPFSVELRVFCNDPNLNGGANPWFSLLLRGEGTLAAVKLRPQAGSPDVLADFDFGNVHRDANTGRQIVVESTGSSRADAVELRGLSAPFSAVAQWGAGATDLNPSETRTIDIGFNPTTHGLFRDTLEVTGENFSPQQLVLQAYSYFDSVFIYFDWERREAATDTIDFGYQPEGKNDTVSFFVRNYGNMEIGFMQQNQTAPDYVIANYNDPISNDLISSTIHYNDDLIDVIENRYVARRPLDVAGSYTEREFKLIFLGGESDFREPEFYGLKRVDFTFTMRDTVDTSRMYRKEFVVRTIKTDALLVGKPPILDFGMVYLNASRTLEMELENCGRAVEPFDSRLLNKGASGGSFDLRSGAFNIPGFIDEKQVLSLPFIFEPSDLGLDEAEFFVAYNTTGEARQDTTRIKLRGRGVEQKLTFTSLNSSGIVPTVDDRGDTVIIDLGEVNVCNDSRSFTFRLRNDGNFRYGVRRVIQRTNSVDNDFTISNLPVNGAGLEPGELSDQVRVIFTPQRVAGVGVVQEVERIIESDIDERVFRSPESVRQLVLIFRARPVAAVLAVEPLGPVLEDGTLDFDTLAVLPDCVNERVLALRVINGGNQDLQLSNISLVQPTAFGFRGTAERRMGPNQDDTIYIHFQPNAVGRIRDTLRFSHNGGCPDSSYALPVVGVGVTPPALRVDIPDVTRAQPGKLVEIPLLLPDLAGQQQISNIETVNIELEYNRTTLQFEDFLTAGTAARNLSSDDISSAETDGVLQLELRSSAALQPSDTLLRLRFNTYVGNAAVTPINIASIRLGNSDCDEIVSVDTVGSGGVFVADSVCGVHVLTIGGSAGRTFGLRSPSPNPLEGDIAIEYEVAYPTVVDIQLFNSMGTLVRQVAAGKHPPGVFLAQLDGSTLAAGTYYCVMRAGIYTATHTLVKTR